MIKIAPSLLSADFNHLKDSVESVAAADLLHLDVMDGVFVPNISFGFPVLEAVRAVTDLPIDAHLMITKPVRYAARFAQAGAEFVVVHPEADEPGEIMRALEEVRAAGKKPGIAIKPATPVEVLESYLPYISMALVMTVEPGFGGQKFMADMLPKIQTLRTFIEQNQLACELEVDGGIDAQTSPLVKAAGANVLVAGSAVFKQQDRASAIQMIREA
jgi:ribulose-phosphate 3-epimerase